MASCVSRAEALADSAPADAIDAVTKCTECSDSPPVAFQLLASLQSEAGARDDARKTLLAGVAHHANSPLLWLALGRLELAASRPREGISALARAHRLSPEDSNLEEEYQHALRRHGTKDERVEAKVQPLLLEAIGRYELEDVDGAVRALEAALKTAHGVARVEAQVRHRLGVVALGRQKLRPAAAHFSAGLKLAKRRGPLRADLLLGYAETLLALGKTAEAVAAAKEAVQIDPTNPLALTDLAVGQAASQDIDAALESLAAAQQAGIARRLTKTQLLAIPAFAPLVEDARFKAWVEATWPSR